MLPIIINTECSPYSITLIVLSTNAISSSVSSYFLYSSSSVQDLLKSCKGTKRYVLLGVCCEILQADTRTRKNLVLRYEMKFFASISVLNATYRNVCEHTAVSPMYSGFPTTYGSLPEPAASGINTLGQSISPVFFLMLSLDT